VSELIAFVFRDQYRAPEVLNELRRRDWPWVKDLDDAVVITFNDKGKARAQLTVDLCTGEAAPWARLWGSLLNTTLFLPTAEVIVEAADGIDIRTHPSGKSRRNSHATPEAEWWRESLEHSDNFKRDTAALMSANGSAIFILLRTAEPAKVMQLLRNYGDTIVHTSIIPEQDKKMEAILGTRQEKES
jgi:uncharacterized membrane protein